MNAYNSKKKDDNQFLAEFEKRKLSEKIEKLIEVSDLKEICGNFNEWKKNLEENKAYNQADEFSNMLQLISNPLRLKILFILLERDWACNCEFEFAFNCHQTLISHHLRSLRDGGLITYKKKGQWKLYRINEDARFFLEKLRDLVQLNPKNTFSK